MRLVLSGYYGFDNVGDEAILFSIISALRQADEHIEITVLSNDPEKTASEYGVEAVNRWKIKEVAAAVRASNGVISGGGSLLQDETGNKSVVYYSAIMWIAKFFRKPFFIYAQGIGPLHQNINKKIVRTSLNRSQLLTVRDEESQQLLETIGVKKPIMRVPDPVLGIGYNKEEEPRLIPEKFVSVSVRDWPSDYNFKKKIAESLDEIARLGYKIVFIPMHGKADAEASADTSAFMKEAAMIAPYEGTIMQKVAWINQSEMLIGMRLHALIFAAVGDTPFVALSYDPKIDSFAKLCHQPIAAHVNDDWQSGKLSAIALEQLNRLDEAVERMTRYTNKAKTEAAMTAKNVLDLLNKKGK